MLYTNKLNVLLANQNFHVANAVNMCQQNLTEVTEMGIQGRTRGR